MITDKKPSCQLSGKDGNVYNIIALVSSALRKSGQAKKALSSSSYEDVLALCFDYVDVT